MRRPRSPSPQVQAARRAGVVDERVLAALAAVPRERFVPPSARSEAALDRPVSIGDGQTTSQPSLVASMLAALQLDGTERVLEIGTGLGYQAALLAHLAADVVTVERFPSLAARARDNLARCGLDVEVVVADGTRGLPDRAPFDAIIVAAAAPAVPAALGDQLVEGGRLVAPIGRRSAQVVIVFTRRGGELEEVQRLSAVRFVPLVATDRPDAVGGNEDRC